MQAEASYISAMGDFRKAKTAHCFLEAHSKTNQYISGLPIEVKPSASVITTLSYTLAQ
jgi:hypothetical protein